MSALVGLELRYRYESIVTEFGRKELSLNFKYELNTEDLGWKNGFGIVINESGEIITCDSLTSSTNSIDYYISMGEVLKQVVSFIENSGKTIFDKILEIKENEREKLNIINSLNLKINSLESSISLINNNINILHKKRKRAKSTRNNIDIELKNLNEKLKELKELQSKKIIEKNELSDIVDTTIYEKSNDYLKLNFESLKK